MHRFLIHAQFRIRFAQKSYKLLNKKLLLLSNWLNICFALFQLIVNLFICIMYIAWETVLLLTVRLIRDLSLSLYIFLIMIFFFSCVCWISRIFHLLINLFNVRNQSRIRLKNWYVFMLQLGPYRLWLWFDWILIDFCISFYHFF